MRMDSVIRIISGIGLYAEFEAALPFRIEERCPGASWFVTCRDSATLDQSKGLRPLRNGSGDYFASEGQVAGNIL
jgi:hypothetical protein